MFPLIMYVNKQTNILPYYYTLKNHVINESLQITLCHKKQVIFLTSKKLNQFMFIDFDPCLFSTFYSVKYVLYTL